MADCIRTLPQVTFPASLLLKREEIETQTIAGSSVITPLISGGGHTARAYVEAPFDLMYGFRGSKYDVDLLSPYQMLLHWGLVRITPPTAVDSSQRAQCTTSGCAYREECKVARTTPHYKAGAHCGSGRRR